MREYKEYLNEDIQRIINYSERKKEFCIHYNYFINIALQIRKLRLLPAYRLIVNEKYIFRLL